MNQWEGFPLRTIDFENVFKMQLIRLFGPTSASLELTDFVRKLQVQTEAMQTNSLEEGTVSLSRNERENHNALSKMRIYLELGNIASIDVCFLPL